MGWLLEGKVSVLVAGALSSVALLTGFGLARYDEPVNRWACHAEDQVVIIDNTCQHIDTLTHDDLERFAQEGVAP